MKSRHFSLSFVEDLTSQEVFQWRLADLSHRVNRPFTISGNSTVAAAPQEVVFPAPLAPAQREWIWLLPARRASRKLIKRAIARNGIHPAEALLDGIEVGGFRILLKSGHEHFCFHTSSELEGIRVADILKSINGLMSARVVRLEEIAAIEHFHTHPARPGQIPDPISASDEAMIRMLKRQMVRVLGEDVAPEVHCYAIGSIEGQTFLYHLAY